MIVATPSYPIRLQPRGYSEGQDIPIVSTTSAESPLGNTFNCFSSFHKIISVTSRIYRFRNNYKRNNESRVIGEFGVPEINRIELTNMKKYMHIYKLRNLFAKAEIAATAVPIQSEEAIKASFPERTKGSGYEGIPYTQLPDATEERYQR
ncbi:hypothetical protein NPIL_438861 [Nephila pilipes]|uniref:Uncharacterized protein n=1 Tax=Nephila pilipes TaxID=299642 RepID=A0A8X6PP56_NEPPI|nr:hypothetical protein NPIL_438861 [Nephila pilipes]